MKIGRSNWCSTEDLELLIRHNITPIVDCRYVKKKETKEPGQPADKFKLGCLTKLERLKVRKQYMVVSSSVKFYIVWICVNLGKLAPRTYLTNGLAVKD